MCARPSVQPMLIHQLPETKMRSTRAAHSQRCYCDNGFTSPTRTVGFQPASPSVRPT